MKTTKFFANVGVVAGYGHRNETKGSAADIVSTVWQEEATAYFDQRNVYVGVVVADANTVYHTEWGCPVGGEKTVFITGECNPEYTDLTKYKTAVIEVLRRVARRLGQSTTQATFQEVEFEYLDFRSDS